LIDDLGHETSTQLTLVNKQKNNTIIHHRDQKNLKRIRRCEKCSLSISWQSTLVSRASKGCVGSFIIQWLKLECNKEAMITRLNLGDHFLPMDGLTTRTSLRDQ